MSFCDTRISPVLAVIVAYTNVDLQLEISFEHQDCVIREAHTCNGERRAYAWGLRLRTSDKLFIKSVCGKIPRAGKQGTS